MPTVRFSTSRVMALDREVEGVSPVALEEPAHEGVEGVALQEEGVVAEVGGELRVAGPLSGAKERERDRPVLLRGEQPVAREADDEGLGQYRGKRLLERARGARRVELVDRAGDVEVGVRVEAVDEALALVAQVALHLELGVERVGLA